MNTEISSLEIGRNLGACDIRQATQSYAGTMSLGCENDTNKIKPINIEQIDYGYIVTVGCQKFAIEDKIKLLELLGLYLKNPQKTAIDWFGNSFLIKKF